MIRTHSRQQQDLPIIDLTALLDIIFIVLVFLLLATNIPLKQMNIDLPTVNNAQSITEIKPKIIKLHLFATKPYWAIDEQYYDDWQQFQTEVGLLSTQSQLIPDVVIVVDRNSNSENLLNILNLLQKYQISTARILTKGTP